MRRIAGVGLAGVALAAAAGVTFAIDAGRQRTARQDSERRAAASAEAARLTTAQALAEIESRASAAAIVPELRRAIQSRVDGPTIVDLFDNEDSWAPFRERFPTTALLAGTATLALRGPAVEGLADLAAAAASRGTAAGAVVSAGRPYWVGAARIDVPHAGGSLAIILARPRDATDGAGSGAGHPGAARAPAPAAAAGAGRSKAIVWTIAGLLAVAGLALGLRPAHPGPVSDGDRAVAAAAPSSATRPTEPAFPDGMPVTPPQTPSTPRPFFEAPTIPPPGATRIGAGASAAAPAALAVAAAPSGGGTVFGRYRLVERIGEGGMGEIWKAMTFGAEGFTRVFVLKRLRAELARDAQVVAQFIDEARLGAGLVHSNIIPVFDFGKVGDEYFMAQEYVLGRDLGRITRRSAENTGRCLGIGPVFHAAAQTLEGLGYAHARKDADGKWLGLVHRDVSPNNIMVTPRGEVKLLDFGIVKAEGRVSQTQVGMVKGNISFMAPEQACGQPVDARSDLFSLGLVMFYCLTGENLYQGESTYDLLMKAGTGPTQADRVRIAALPTPAAMIVGRALALDPTARYQSAGEFAAALAPHTVGAAAQVANLMQLLFADEFHAEGA